MKRLSLTSIAILLCAFSAYSAGLEDNWDFMVYYRAAIKACEGKETGDECMMFHQPNELRKGACVYDTGLDGKYINACIVPLQLKPAPEQSSH